MLLTFSVVLVKSNLSVPYVNGHSGLAPWPLRISGGPTGWSPISHKVMASPL